VARSAAAYALGELGDFEAKDVLLGLTQSVDDRLRAAALTVLARGGVSAVEPRLAEAIVYGREPLRRAAIGAAAVLAKGDYRPHPDPLSTPAARVDLEPILANFNSRPANASEEAGALELLGEALSQACRSAVQSSAEQARTVANALLARGGAPAVGDLTARLDDLPADERKRAEATAERIAQSVVDPFVTLASHPSAGLRATAVELLGTRDEVAARQALIKALLDEDAQVQRAALRALETRPHIDTFSGVVALLGSDQPWATRLGAARALSAYARLDREARSTPAFQKGYEQLVDRALQDKNAFVREAALSSLWRLSPDMARPVLQQVVQGDQEPRVVEAARRLLSESETKNSATTGAPTSP
jgi:HEAT repeat protein